MERVYILEARLSARFPGHGHASFGLVPGSEVRLVQRRPAVVLECGATSIAVEDEIGRDIYVRVNAA